MRLYSYIVSRDYGFAPNPFHGWCTLATCKPMIRVKAEVGDWIVGTGSKEKGRDGTLVFAMRVEEVMTFNEYWSDERFRRKRPNLSGSLMQRYGDNIYHRSDPNSDWVQENSHHSFRDGSPNPQNVKADTGADRVLASQTFSYWGGSGPEIPERFREWEGHDLCHDRQGHLVNFPDDLRDAFIRWIVEEHERGYLGQPLEW